MDSEGNRRLEVPPRERMAGPPYSGSDGVVESGGAIAVSGVGRTPG